MLKNHKEDFVIKWSVANIWFFKTCLRYGHCTKCFMKLLEFQVLNHIIWTFKFNFLRSNWKQIWSKVCFVKLRFPLSSIIMFDPQRTASMLHFFWGGFYSYFKTNYKACGSFDPIVFLLYVGSLFTSNVYLPCKNIYLYINVYVSLCNYF